jgi:hypothetical protein
MQMLYNHTLIAWQVTEQTTQEDSLCVKKNSFT